MNRETLQGCGCAVGMLGVLAAIGVGGIFAITATISLLGWPVALAVAALLAAGAGALVFLAIRFVTERMEKARREKPLAPYKTRLKDIDRLMSEIEAAWARVPGSEFDGHAVLGKLAELKRRKDEIVGTLVELDKFLRMPGNGERRLAVESAISRMRSHMGPAQVRPERAENAARLRDVSESIRKVRADREALLANLDRIAIGLRDLRAKLLMPTSSPAGAARDIDEQIAAVARGVEIAEKARREIEDFEQEMAEKEGPYVSPFQGSGEPPERARTRGQGSGEPATDDEPSPEGGPPAREPTKQPH